MLLQDDVTARYVRFALYEIAGFLWKKNKFYFIRKIFGKIFIINFIRFIIIRIIVSRI